MAADAVPGVAEGAGQSDIGQGVRAQLGGGAGFGRVGGPGGGDAPDPVQEGLGLQRGQGHAEPSHAVAGRFDPRVPGRGRGLVAGPGGVGVPGFAQPAGLVPQLGGGASGPEAEQEGFQGPGRGQHGGFELFAGAGLFVGVAGAGGGDAQAQGPAFVVDDPGVGPGHRAVGEGGQDGLVVQGEFLGLLQLGAGGAVGHVQGRGDLGGGQRVGGLQVRARKVRGAGDHLAGRGVLPAGPGALGQFADAFGLPVPVGGEHPHAQAHGLGVQQGPEPFDQDQPLERPCRPNAAGGRHGSIAGSTTRGSGTSGCSADAAQPPAAPPDAARPAATQPAAHHGSASRGPAGRSSSGGAAGCGPGSTCGWAYGAVSMIQE